LPAQPFDAQVAYIGTIAAIFNTVGVVLFTHFNALGSTYFAGAQTINASINTFF